jgi:uncharacterized OB-fold protein
MQVKMHTAPADLTFLNSLAGDALAEDAHGRPVLLGSACDECETLAFPRVAVCSNCMSESVSQQPMPRTGTLYAFTLVHVGPPHWNKPLALGYVDLSNGVRVFTHLANSSMRIGDKVELGIGRIGTRPDGSAIETYVFKPMGA